MPPSTLYMRVLALKAALLLPGRTVVVSPLIALMKDQCESLRELGVDAVQVNSAIGSEEARGKGTATPATRSAAIKTVKTLGRATKQDRARANTSSKWT